MSVIGKATGVGSRLICPRCFYLLMKEEVRGQWVDHCIRCGGTFLEKGSENVVLGKTASLDIWKGTEICEKAASEKLICPQDHHTLNTYRVAFDDESVDIDACPECDGLWLDPQEGKKLLDIVLHAGQSKASTLNEKPGAKSYIFQLFSGLPVEAWNPVHHRPILTLSLMGLLIIAFVMQLMVPSFQDLMLHNTSQFIASEQLWTLVSSGFLHGGVAHLLGNLYFLYIFGDNVEDYVGRWRFSVLYLGALIISTMSFTLVWSHETQSILGASGAIAGLMGAYFALFPKVKLHFVILFIPVRLNAMWYLAGWLIFNVAMMTAGVAGIAWSAHISGFIWGVMIGLALRFQSIREHIQRK